MEQIHYGFNEVPGGEGWVSFWYSDNAFTTRQLTNFTVDDSGSNYQTSMPLCSLFDRVPPMRNERKDGDFHQTRKDVLRVGARALNVSPAVAAGSMVILAQAQGPLPVPLRVDGDVPSGEGMILCQFILPMGRPSAQAPATTQAVNVEK
jgi:hypothetical protein